MRAKQFKTVNKHPALLRRLFLAVVVLLSLFFFRAPHVSASASVSVSASQAKLDVSALQAKYKGYYKTSNELINKIDSVIKNLDETEPAVTRIKLDLWRLHALTDITDTRVISNFAKEFYHKYALEDYQSDLLFGRAMSEIIQSLTKTLELDLCFEIIEKLRSKAYENPNPALELMIDRSLMEIYIETFDYQHALDIELSILDNPKYETLESYQVWKPFLYNEIAFLYNKLGNGEKAHDYLDTAKAAYETLDLLPHKRLKAEANNDGNRGRAYLLEGRYEDAAQMGEKVLEAGTLLNQKYVKTLGYRLIGSAALNRGDYNVARDMLEKGINLADEYHIATMKKSLYRDYVATLEKLDLKDIAFEWHKKLFKLEMAAQRTVSDSREALFLAESRAATQYNEILDLKQKNKTQKLLSLREKSINRLLLTIIILLLFAAIIMGRLFYWYRKNQVTLILSEKKARQANLIAQEANQAKTEFLANMSHEIRTPMNGVLGMAQVLQTTKLNKKQFEYTNIILKSGNNLMKIIGDILDLSKIESGKLILNPEPCNLKALIHDIEHLFKVSASSKNLNLELDYAPDCPEYFHADKQRIRQITTNLVGNAIKFTESGSVKISVSGEVEDEIATINIAVKDTGIGIKPEKMETVFEKFTQAEGSTTRLYGGSGLGLTISRNLVTAMNGQLNVASEYGRGSTFTVSLPLPLFSPLDIEHIQMKNNQTEKRLVEPLPNSKRPNVRPQPKARPILDSKNLATLSHLSFLIIGVDKNQNHILARLFEHPEANITMAYNNHDAINSLKIRHFDMIFLNMPEFVMQSILTAKTLREYERNNKQPATPIICLRKDKLEENNELCLENGVSECVSSPVQKELLSKVIKAHLRPISKTKTMAEEQQSYAI